MTEITRIIQIIADVATPISVVVAVVCYLLDRKRTNKAATLEAYAHLQDFVFDELNHWMPKEIEEAMEDPRSDAAKTLSSYLARIELFCTGLNNHIYDFNVFYSVAHRYFDEGTMHNRIIAIIEAKSENSEKDDFANIHEVWKKMNMRRRCWD